jgi:hypothetical protein
MSTQCREDDISPGWRRDAVLGSLERLFLNWLAGRHAAVGAAPLEVGCERAT